MDIELQPAHPDCPSAFVVVVDGEWHGDVELRYDGTWEGDISQGVAAPSTGHAALTDAVSYVLRRPFDPTSDKLVITTKFYDGDAYDSEEN